MPPISQPLLTDLEREQVLVEWNQTAREYPQDQCVHQLFEAQVERTPEAVAVVFEGQSLTYRELNARANQLGHHLRSLGVGPDVLVGLCVERSLEMIVALLGILKAGGAYVPLDPLLPRERLAFMVQDINAPLVLIQQRWCDRLSLSPGGTRTQLLILEELPALLAAAPQSNPPCLSTPAHLAYVLYTSGTTGQPKGVMIEHRGIVRLVIQPDYVALSAQEIMLQFAPLAFDASTFEIWGSLLHGGRLVVCPARHLDYDELARTITAHGVTTLWLTAALFHEMLEHAPAALAGVRQLLTGGDVLSPAKVRAYLELPGHGRLINGYGPTESTTFTCCYGLDSAEQIGYTVPIGRPIANTRVYLLDAHFRPVAIGVPGELFIGGDGLARGYLNRPELTAERFMADPFSSEPGARLYKTGDLARYLPDGNIEYLGRLDHQVKIRGYRIELGEIEAVLGGHPELADGAVVPRSQAGGDKTLAAFVVARGTVVLSAASLRLWLGEKLPEYMIPSRFYVLPGLPLTPNGKVDRKALEQLDGVELEAGTDYVAPGTELETRLVEIWQAVLGRERIGIHDNFFDLGGNSLLAARLFSQIERALETKLPLATLFQAPSVRKLAEVLRHRGWTPPWQSLVPIRPSGTRRPLFLIHGVGGNILGFEDLVSHLGEDQPVFGLQSPGLDGKSAKASSVEEMAEIYMREILALQPAGPYHLCGLSFGGVVAFELAHQLLRKGHQVGLLALLDSYPQGYSELLPLTHQAWKMMGFWKRRIEGHLHEMRRQNSLRAYLQKKMKTLRRRVKSRVWQLKYRGYEAKGEPLPQEFQDVRELNALAGRRYVVKAYPGKVTLFLASENVTSNACALRTAWGHVAVGGLEIHEVPGDHVTIIHDPHVATLARQLRRCLDDFASQRFGR